MRCNTRTVLKTSVDYNIWSDVVTERSRSVEEGSREEGIVRPVRNERGRGAEAVGTPQQGARGRGEDGQEALSSATLLSAGRVDSSCPPAASSTSHEQSSAPAPGMELSITYLQHGVVGVSSKGD